ncbi:MAG: ComEC/Rec2 family competence protein [Anaerolineales bacterium]
MPLFWLSLAFMGGIILGELLEWLGLIWYLLLGLAVFLAACGFLVKRRWPGRFERISKIPHLSVPYSILLASVCLGGIRYQSIQPVINPDHIAWYRDAREAYTVQGIIVEPSQEFDRFTYLKVRVQELHPVGERLFTPVSGLLLARVPPGGDWHYGDQVRLEGDIHNPPEREGFSYREYLARQNVHAYMPGAQAVVLAGGYGSPVKRSIYSLRGRALDMTYRLFPDPEASLLAGILLGVETGIPQGVQDAFNDTGTSHIIAISGFNITILATFFVFLFGRILGVRRRFMAACITALIISLYTVLVGADAAVVRAAIMGGLSLLAALVGRRQDGLNTLALVAAVMALFNPYVLWDVGFQLSFMATLGLLLYAGPLTERFIRLASKGVPENIAKKAAKPVGDYFLITIAALITTLPVVIYHFQRLSLISLAANPAILPAQPPLMILGGIAVILGLIYQPLGQIAALAAWPFAAYTIRIVEWFAGIPGVVLYLGEAAFFTVLLFYFLLFAWTFAGGRFGKWLARLTDAGFAKYGRHAPVLLLVMGLFAVTVWRAALAAPDGRLHVTLLDVGSGDAVLVQTPSGRSLLIDGGPSASQLSQGLGRRLPLSRRRLDYVIVAAPESDQVGALAIVVKRFPPGEVLWAGAPAGTFSARELRRVLAQEEIRVVLLEGGQSLELGGGAQIRVLAVDSLGAVLYLEWKKFSLLLPIGMSFETMDNLFKRNNFAPVSALLLSQSGYAPLNTPEWIEFWKPELVMLSVEAGDSDGLPDQETLESTKGYNLLRTDMNGWIHLSTDGEFMWVETERR